MNRTHIWANPLLPGIEFFTAHYTDFAYGRHFHEDYAIGVVEHGIHAFYYRGVNYAIAPDYVVTCQPGEVHTGHPGSVDVWRFRMMYLSPILVQQVAAELGYRPKSLPFLNNTAIAHRQVVQAVRAAHHSAEQCQPTLSQEILLHDMLRLVLSHYSDIRLNPPSVGDENVPVARAKSYMQEHYAEDLQLGDLAAVAHLSKSYLIRAFRRHENLSPYAYLIVVRLNRAKALLQQGRSAVDVAHETGFFDQSHFTHCFKRFMGVSPGTYQRAIG